MTIPITITLSDSIQIIERRVNSSIARLVNQKILNKQVSIKSKIINLVSNWVYGQPEIISLISSSPGSLAGQFGLTTRVGIDEIISAIRNSVDIRFNPFNDRLIGGLDINIQPANFSNILNLAAGHVRYSGGDLHWLDWLLKRGDTVIVTNYSYNPQTGLGRSGLGNMIPGGFFRVPPQFSGTEDNNFITRALIGSSQEKQISQILREAIEQ